MKKLIILIACSVSIVVNASDCVEVFTFSKEAPSILPKGKNFKLVWNDEFDGDKLDTTKWGFRTNFWGQKAHWFAGPEDNAVEVKDGKLHMKLVKDKNGQFKSPQLQTGELIWDMPAIEERKIFWPFGKRETPKFMHKYGYYECRCRLQQKEGWWTAFWMQTPSQGASLNPESVGIEHDIMESFNVGDIIPLCFHYNGYGLDHRQFEIARVAADDGTDLSKVDVKEYHTFGLLWEPDGYTAFQDGRQVGPKTSVAVSHTEQFVLLTTEAKWFRDDKMRGKGVPELEAALGDEFIVDFVRVYDIVK